MLRQPRILGGPQQRGRNQKSKRTLGVTIMLLGPLHSRSPMGEGGWKKRVPNLGMLGGGGGVGTARRFGRPECQSAGRRSGRPTRSPSRTAGT